jgi:hypothetical protein
MTRTASGTAEDLPLASAALNFNNTNVLGVGYWAFTSSAEIQVPSTYGQVSLATTSTPVSDVGWAFPAGSTSDHHTLLLEYGSGYGRTSPWAGAVDLSTNSLVGPTETFNVTYIPWDYENDYITTRMVQGAPQPISASVIGFYDNVVLTRPVFVTDSGASPPPSSKKAWGIGR